MSSWSKNGRRPNSDYAELSYALSQFATALTEGASFIQAAEITDHDGTCLSVVREDASGILLQFSWNGGDCVTNNHSPNEG